MKIKKLVKLAPMMLLTFLLGLSGCSGSTAADARVNDHPSEEDEELHVLTIGTADSGGTMYPIGSAIASVLSGHDEQLKCSFSRKMQNIFASFAKTYFKNRKRTF